MAPRFVYGSHGEAARGCGWMIPTNEPAAPAQRFEVSVLTRNGELEADGWLEDCGPDKRRDRRSTINRSRTDIRNPFPAESELCRRLDNCGDERISESHSSRAERSIHHGHSSAAKHKPARANQVDRALRRSMIA